MAKEAFEDYIFINKLYLSLTGLWPLSDDTSKWCRFMYRVYSTLIVIVVWVFLIIPMILDLYIVRGNIKAMVENLCLSTHCVFVTVKLFHLFINKSVLKKLLKIMKNNWDTSINTSTEQKDILLEHAVFARNFARIFVFTVYYFEVLLFLYPLIYGVNSDPARKNRYPLCAYYYFDQNSNDTFIYFYLSQVLTDFFLSVNYAIAIDTLCCVAIYHSCAQLRILQTEILKIGSEAVSHESIKELVQKHNNQIRVVKIINKLLSKLSLFQLLTSSIVICSTGFQLIASLTGSKIDFHSFFAYVGFVIANLFQILLYCWPGNQLMLQSLEVGNAAYKSLWVNLSQDSLKAVIMIIIRAQKPLILTAGGMYEMTLQNFAGILKISISSLSLLRAVNVNH